MTPAHDQLDFRIASRHWTEIERTVKNAKSSFCLTESGKIKSENPEFSGLDRFEAREKVGFFFDFWKVPIFSEISELSNVLRKHFSAFLF